MLEWNDLSVIMAVGRAGSLSGAARSLGKNHSTVFRRINAIEERTGVRFFERLPSGYRTTAAGEAALACAERIESEVHALGRGVLGQDMRLQGNVKLTSPEGVATMMMPRLLAQYRRMHPGVTLDMVGGAAAIDLTRREADIAIRATRKPPDTSLGRRVCDFRFGVYASPSFIESRRRVPLEDQPWCLLQGTVDWLVPLVWSRGERGVAQTVFTGTSIFAVVNAATEDMGLTMLPCYIADSDDRLVRVTEPLAPLTMQLWILTHPDLRHTARVKTLMAFLYDAFAEEADLFEGKRPREAQRVGTVIGRSDSALDTRR